MDSITHGIAGALVGKAFYARGNREQARIAVTAATIGALFPDSDIILAIFDRRNGAGLEIHRGITHSFLCLPVFAVALAYLTAWVARRRHRDAPPVRMLFLIFGSMIALHIFMDLFTSYGTMIWMPLSKARAAWDLTFIIDFTFTAIVLAPQVLAWAYRDALRWRPRVLAWLLFSVGTLGVYSVAEAAGYAFSAWAVAAISVVFAVIFFAPAVHGWGFDVPRQTWCRAGVAVLILYVALQATAHERARSYLQDFAASHNLRVESMAALPSAPDFLRWTGLIRTPEGVYATYIWLPRRPTRFRFVADPPPNAYIDAAKRTATAQRFLWFARFPHVDYSRNGALHYVDFSDIRFGRIGRRPFVVRVTLNDAGEVIREYWAED